MQILCENLSIGYGNMVLHHNINFSVNKGDYLCIIGENGCGKSTLMRTLLGLQPPLEGKIVFGDGLEQNEIGYLPQQTAVQKDFPASVREIILSGCQNKCFRELSGGQQQRVLLARALCATSKILLLDEPVTGLDPKASEEMYQFISRINREEDITIIMISHDVDNAINDATRVMKIGKDISIRSAEDDR